jgi:Ca2+-transporting ATPase
MKKIILYLFSTGLGEVATIVGALAVGLLLPLLPAQIIWLNLVTDGFLVIALAFEPKDKDILTSAFERPKRYFIDAEMVERILVMGLAMAAGTVVLFNSYLTSEPMKALTVSLTALAVFQWLNAWNCRHERQYLFTTHPFANRYLVGALAIVVALQLVAVYHPLFNHILHTTPLAAADWLRILPVALLVIVVEEIRKLLRGPKLHRTPLSN